MEESGGNSSNSEEIHHSSSWNRRINDDDSSYTDASVGENEEEDDDDDDKESSDTYYDEKEEEEVHIPIPPPRRPGKCPRRGTLTLDDRISSLPDPVIHRILSFLSMKNVVRTGVLSKRWRGLRSSVSTLVFQTRDFTEIDIRKFVDFVNKALILCNCSNIEKFVLDFRYIHCVASDVNVWISFAMQNNVVDLKLLLESRRILREKYRLPQHMLCNSSLKKLSLDNCVVMPSGVISWKSLKSLFMEGVELGDGVIAQILLGSPYLEFLELVGISFSGPFDITSASLKRLVLKECLSAVRQNKSLLEISAPNLQSLELLGECGGLTFRLRNVSSLISANLNILGSYARSWIENNYLVQSLLRELLESLQHVRELKIGNLCLEVLSTLNVEGVPFSLSSCKSLTLDALINAKDSQGIARLLQSAPNIERLVIDIDYCYSELDECDYLHGKYRTSPKRILTCLLPHLKIVKIVGFRGDRGGFQLSFIQLLLKNASTLKTMHISPGKVFSGNRFVECSISEFPKEMQTLLSFPRSSPDAVIMFS